MRCITSAEPIVLPFHGNRYYHLVMRRKITPEVWKQVEVAIASGIGAREVARNMELAEGTVLSHLKRKAVFKQIQIARAEAATKSKPSGEISPFESAARTMQQRGEKYTDRMAGISEKGLSHLESLEAAEILDRAREIELHDRWSRRNYGLDNQPPPSNCPVNFSLLCNQAAILVSEKQPAE